MLAWRGRGPTLRILNLLSLRGTLKRVVRRLTRNCLAVAVCAGARRAFICAIWLALTPRPAAAEQMLSLILLPNTYWGEALGVSADGSVVVGRCSPHHGGLPTGSQAVLWNRAGDVTSLGTLSPDLNESLACGVSADGRVIVGACRIRMVGRSPPARAFRWTLATGMRDLGALPGGVESWARAANSDGSVVVGRSVTQSGGLAFRWTQAGGMKSLGTLPGDEESDARAVSADGSVVVGWSRSKTGYRAFRWTQAGGMQAITPPTGTTQCWARGVSADGTVVVGGMRVGADDRAFRWTQASGMQELGVLPGGRTSEACAVSADGRVVVGRSQYQNAELPNWPGEHAFRWTAEGGMRDLGSMRGPQVNETVSIAYAASSDGSVVVGDSSKAEERSRAIRWEVP